MAVSDSVWRAMTLQAVFWTGFLSSSSSSSSGAELCRSCVPPAHQLASLLQSLA